MANDPLNPVPEDSPHPEVDPTPGFWTTPPKMNPTAKIFLAAIIICSIAAYFWGR